MSMMLPFTKMVGTGNDFIVFDARTVSLPDDLTMLAKDVCHRQRGVGADGVLVLEPTDDADVRMHIVNADGSVAAMCGNGARCVAWLALGGETGAVSLATGAGLVEAEVRGNIVTVSLTPPQEWSLEETMTLDGHTVQVASVYVGVPHAIVFVENIASAPLDVLGSALRHHARYAPEGTNVSCVQVTGHRAVHVRTYERGVEGETLACGTGAVASVIAALLNGRLPDVSSEEIEVVQVTTSGGEQLEVSFQWNGQHLESVRLTGAVARVFEGNIAWPAAPLTR